MVLFFAFSGLHSLNSFHCFVSLLSALLFRSLTIIIITNNLIYIKPFFFFFFLQFTDRLLLLLSIYERPGVMW